MEQNMRAYEYYLYGDSNGYGQPTLSEETQGQIKMAIYETSTSVQQNINYAEATYIGLTHDANVNDKYVIAVGEAKLKVLYVKPGRYKQVFLGAM